MYSFELNVKVVFFALNIEESIHQQFLSSFDLKATASNHHTLRVGVLSQSKARRVIEEEVVH